MAGRRKGVLGKISVLLKLITYWFCISDPLKVAQVLTSIALYAPICKDRQSNSYCFEVCIFVNKMGNIIELFRMAIDSRNPELSKNVYCVSQMYNSKNHYPGK